MAEWAGQSFPGLFAAQPGFVSHHSFSAANLAAALLRLAAGVRADHASDADVAFDLLDRPGESGAGVDRGRFSLARVGAGPAVRHPAGRDRALSDPGDPLGAEGTLSPAGDIHAWLHAPEARLVAAAQQRSGSAPREASTVDAPAPSGVQGRGGSSVKQNPPPAAN